MNLRKLLSFVLVLPLLVPAMASAGEFSVQMPPAKDNTLYEDDAGALSNGAGEYIFVGRVANMGGNLLRRALLGFDVASILPDDAVVTSASLTLNMSMSVVGETDVALHRVTSDWGEGTSDAPGQEGQGVASTTGDATWIHSFFDTTTWTTPGGDFAAASATAPVAGNGSYTWGSNAAMVADVQGWVDTPSNDFGWILLGDEVLAPPTAKRFDSRENGTAAGQPQLSITFMSTSLVFLDNFESGDVSAWTTSVP